MNNRGQDKKYYPCVVLSESDDKELLTKSKTAIDALTKKRSGSAIKENKQPRKKNKAKSPVSVSSKAQSQQEKNKAEKEREEKKKEKIEKKKALDERDLNILAQLSKLNRSIVVVNEHNRDMEEETELARKKHDLDRRENEVEGTEGAHAHKVHEVNKNNAVRTRDLPEIARPSRRKIEEDDEADEEYLGNGFDDSGVMECYTEDIDVLEASNIIKTPERPTTGEKRPQANPLAVGTTAKKCPRRRVVQPECAQCCHLLAEIKELREANALLTEKLNAQRMEVQPSEAPRPGK